MDSLLGPLEGVRFAVHTRQEIDVPSSALGHLEVLIKWSFSELKNSKKNNYFTQLVIDSTGLMLAPLHP